MIRIGDTVMTLDLVRECFSCDLKACMGDCCRYGDAGAPLSGEEVKLLKEIYPALKPYLREEGIRYIEKQGTSLTDNDGEYVTPLIADEECAYTILSDGILLCGIEKAWSEGAVDFRKPLSCHLFPVRTKDYNGFTAINYERWSLCRDAVEAGRKEGIPLYVFLRDPLIRAFGEEWYNELLKAAAELPEDI